MPLTLITNTTKIYMYNTHSFEVILTDEEDNPVSDEEIVLYINNVETNIKGTTDERGIANLKITTSTLGEFTISAHSSTEISNKLTIDVIYGYHLDTISDAVSYNYRTLNKDIALFKRYNGQWDLMFDKGDLVSATELHSLQTGIIIACLTSWNYLARYGNPTYAEFGNEAYTLLKANKGVNTRYKIEQFFIDCLNRMRRVYLVEDLTVNDVPNNPYMYYVTFSVISINNELVNGEFIINDETGKNSSSIRLSYNHPYTSVTDPLNVEINLVGEYGNALADEVIHVFIRSEKGKQKFYGVTTPTNEYGVTGITIPPNELSGKTEIYFIFRGNSLYNSCISNVINIESIGYYFRIKPILKTVDGEVQYHYLTDDYGNIIEKDGIPVLDYSNPIVEAEILSVEGIDNPSQYFRLGKIVDSLDIELPTYVEDYNLMYIIKEDDEYVPYEMDIEKYNAGEEYMTPIKSHGAIEKVRLLSTPKVDEIHLFVRDGEFDGYFEIDSKDDHLYYITEKWFNLEDWYNYDD